MYSAEPACGRVWLLDLCFWLLALIRFWFGGSLSCCRPFICPDCVTLLSSLMALVPPPLSPSLISALRRSSLAFNVRPNCQFCQLCPVTSVKLWKLTLSPESVWRKGTGSRTAGRFLQTVGSQFLHVGLVFFSGLSGVQLPYQRREAWSGQENRKTRPRSGSGSGAGWLPTSDLPVRHQISPSLSVKPQGPSL